MWLLLQNIEEFYILDTLEPLHFINDLEENVHGQMFKFADDTKIFSCIKDSMDSNKLQKGLDKITDWAFLKWQMDLNFNVSKSKVMHVGKLILRSYTT